MPSPQTPLPNPVAKGLPNQNQTSKKKLRVAVTQSSSPCVKPPQHDQQQALIKCPRCYSSSTKFCYYNNYSLAQPRHFCNTCRRYWTKGGSLRNVPVGGGSRKTKRLKSSSSSSSSKDFPTNIGGLKRSPAIDYQLGGIELPRAIAPNAQTGGIYYTEYPVLGEGSPSTILGSFNFPLQMVIPPKQPQPPYSSVGPPSSTLKIDGNLVSSIESLSCINQDLHWKLHQQRLAALYADSIPRDGRSPSSRSAPQQVNIANGSNSAPLATEWFFGNSASYTSVTPSPTDSHGNENMICNNWHHSSNNNNNNDNSNSGAAVIRLDHDQGWGC